eukprot:TRINITY_DN13739_c3_g1_i1.p1 TRINITY_DN13739_c3_g1~~TRINITY_DN13739_c3_g1_i1.p1  ORF type:complete len:228 (+),score=37.10 TRINITY_DN13739_c3_g1_i1:44-727(+)
MGTCSTKEKKIREQVIRERGSPVTPVTPERLSSQGFAAAMQNPCGYGSGLFDTENDEVIARVLSSDEILDQQRYLQRRVAKMAARREKVKARQQNKMQSILANEFASFRHNQQKQPKPPMVQRRLTPPSTSAAPLYPPHPVIIPDFNNISDPIPPSIAPSPSHASVCATDCIICYEPNKKNPQYLPCIHGFHKECIVEWIKSSKSEPACPVCAMEIPPEVVAMLSRM